ncbi:hypothetical protein [Streptomyces griseus]
MSPEQKPATPPPVPSDPVLADLEWLQRTREERLAEARKGERR